MRRDLLSQPASSLRSRVNILILLCTVRASGQRFTTGICPLLSRVKGNRVYASSFFICTINCYRLANLLEKHISVSYAFKMDRLKNIEISFFFSSPPFPSQTCFILRNCEVITCSKTGLTFNLFFFFLNKRMKLYYNMQNKQIFIRENGQVSIRIIE